MATLSSGHGGARVVAAAHSGVQRRQGPAAARQREGGGERETVEERERPAVEETAERSRLRRSVSRSDRPPFWVRVPFDFSSPRSTSVPVQFNFQICWFGSRHQLVHCSVPVLVSVQFCLGSRFKIRALFRSGQLGQKVKLGQL
ncbi:hypothetical protein HanXRQr2_Chr01g0005251 [Helianthus annuus]|uniref:Uncharacterized protein n=1 Tax=Helianthus annuus TaxID=4232 RepID=A0A9K3JT02_HELAN|nr:uncharacterized protein LOC118492525 [Helianthus annuus]KAF5820712.1 hypothetical protein HanXRQr2_Chr01g0005251 [Helianthus annuus]